MSIPKNISKKDILKAITRIDKEGVPAHREAREYALVYEGKQYPCKLIISWANLYANRTELNSETFITYEAQNYLKDKGFKIIQFDSPSDVDDKSRKINKAVWIAFDFGLRGDYTGLYTWLDNHKAVECGNGLAFFFYRIEKTLSEENLINEIRKSLNDVKLSKNDRLYIICKSGNKIIGEFINGGRKQSPWEGFGQLNKESMKDTGE